MPPRVYQMPLCGYNCQWSPFDATKIAVAQSQNYGLVGTGGVAILDVNPMGVQVFRQFQTPDSTYDVCFNEAMQTQILSAGGDGSLRLWDIANTAQPIAAVKGHTGEVFGCEWNHINKKSILSASFDKTIKLWDAQTFQNGPIQSFQHDFTVYSAVWHPTHESIFGSCSGDQTCRVWDLRSGKDVKKIHAHSNEVLSMDFNKYENFIATASTDNMIKVWDLRATTDVPIMTLTDHQLAVRRIKFSPYHANVLASASYDMSVIVWDCNMQLPMNRFTHHSEFAVGLDFSMHQEGVLASTSWDKTVAMFRIDDAPQSFQLVK